MFSKTTEYALRAVIYIAQKSAADKKIGITEIAEAIDAPTSFTAKILQQLTKDGKIIKSVRGPGGGFYMPATAQKKAVRLILEIMEEDEVLDKCVLGLANCSETKPCPMHARYKEIKTQLIRLFEEKTIEDLVSGLATGKTYINNRSKGR
ncbi:MAG: Rrf2 family transcriptional regulator [Chitinophagaceae bacterium]|nr:Rrf2 family transcriptional regulator [Chitinophagaceae bacterium]MCB0740290.1 Rrf2 family transcriptional regulator [Chitinophagaceae bacterium]HQV07333.1 Rrf2 family transcriptional regulator [Chitinophagaceae bacterium]